MLEALVAGCEEDQAALHRPRLVAVRVRAGVLDEVVDGVAERGLGIVEPVGSGGSLFVAVVIIPPAVVGNDGAVVGRPHKGGGIVALVITFGSEDVAGHDTYAAHAVHAAGDTAHADAVVVDGGDGAGHVRAMLVDEQLVRIISLDEVAASFLRRQHDAEHVLVVGLDAAVNDGDDDVAGAAGVVPPDRFDVDVRARDEVGRYAAVVDVVPLFRQMRVVEDRAALLFGLEHDGFHIRQCAEVLAGFGAGHGRVVADPVPAVQAGGAVARLEFAGVREHALQGADAQGFQGFGVPCEVEAVGALFGDEQHGFAGNIAAFGSGL